MKCGMVLAGCAVFFPKVRNGIPAETIHTLGEPEKEIPGHLNQDQRIFIIQVGLELKEPDGNNTSLHPFASCFRTSLQI